MYNSRSLRVNSILNVVKSLLRIAFPMLTLPYISRVLNVSNIGKYNFAVTYVSYFAYIAQLGISSYGIRTGAALRDNKDDIENFISEVFTINIISTVTAYTFLFLSLVFIDSLQKYILLICISSITIFFTTIGMEWVFSIFEDYIFTTIRSVVFQILSFILLFVFVKDESDIYWYCFLTVFSSVGSNIFNILYSRRYCKISLKLNHSVVKHIKPILYIFASDIAVFLYVNSDITMLGLLAGDSYVGFYSLSTKIYSGMKVLLSALIVVTIPRLSNLIGKGKIKEYKVLLARLFETLMTFMMPLSVLFFTMGTEIVYIVGGDKYNEAICSMKLLCVAIVFCELSYVYTQCILMPLQKEKHLMTITFVSALINILLNIVIIPGFKQNGAAVTTIIAELSVYIMARSLTNTCVSFKDSKSLILKILIGCVAVVISCNIIKEYVYNPFAIIMYCGIASVFVYTGVEIVLQNHIILRCLDNTTLMLGQLIKKKER